MKARLPKGMGGGPQNMQAMIRQAQKMQEDMEKLQAELDEKEHEVSAGGGAVKVKIRGNREIVSLELSEDVVDPDDIETLQDLIIAAVNEAVKTVDKLNSEEMNKVTAGLNVPGLMEYESRTSRIHAQSRTRHRGGGQALLFGRGRGRYHGKNDAGKDRKLHRNAHDLRP